MKNGCQLLSYQGVAYEPLTWFVHRRVRGAGLKLNEWKRKLLAFISGKQASGPARPAARPAAPATEINTGDLVRVKPLEEIKQTLDANGFCRGCGFLAPMAQYCGQEIKVARRVDQFFDEARWRMLKCKGIVLLEGVYCDGSGQPETRACDRMCFFFWRTDWLDKVS